MIHHYFNPPKDFDATLWLSQIVQGFGIKMGAEYWRQTMPKSMGCVYWQYNDIWPGMSWSSVDYFGRWKALHYMARRFYSPMLVSGLENTTDGTIDLFVTSDELESHHGKLSWNVTDLAGKTLRHDSMSVRIPSRNSSKVKTLNLQAEIKTQGANGLLTWLKLEVNGKTVSENLGVARVAKGIEIAGSPIDGGGKGIRQWIPGHHQVCAAGAMGLAGVGKRGCEICRQLFPSEAGRGTDDSGSAKTTDQAARLSSATFKSAVCMIRIYRHEISRPAGSAKDILMIFKKTNWRLVLLPVALCMLLTPVTKTTAASESNSWSLVSPINECRITVTLSDDGRLSYEALRDGKVVIQKSPLGLRCNDQDFENNLSLDSADKAHSQREKYELFAGVQPQVNHLLNYPHGWTFRNSNGVPIEIELAASDEGVAFRYRFPETNVHGARRQRRN